MITWTRMVDCLLRCPCPSHFDSGGSGVLSDSMLTWLQRVRHTTQPIRDLRQDRITWLCGCRRVLTQNAKFYNRFPADIPVVQGIVRRLAEYPGGGVPLPTGGILSPRGFQLLGLSGLGSGGGFERLHYLLERAFDGPDISLAFLSVRALCCSAVFPC